MCDARAALLPTHMHLASVRVPCLPIHTRTQTDTVKLAHTRSHRWPACAYVCNCVLLCLCVCARLSLSLYLYVCVCLCAQAGPTAAIIWHA
jgi:hypothetical protein